VWEMEAKANCISLVPRLARLSQRYGDCELSTWNFQGHHSLGSSTHLEPIRPTGKTESGRRCSASAVPCIPLRSPMGPDSTHRPHSRPWSPSSNHPHSTLPSFEKNLLEGNVAPNIRPRRNHHCGWATCATSFAPSNFRCSR
jgi:hypothetical protein